MLLGYGTVFVATGSPVHLIENLNNTGVVTHQLSFPTLGALQLVVSAVDAGDVDRDGNTDLVLGLSATYSGPPLVTAFAVLRRVGPGLIFEAPRLFAAPSFARLADLDDDGDLDVTGQSFLFNRRFVNPAAGSSRQYGVGSPGTGGIVPILGRSGPLRPGLFAGIRIRRGLGATSGVLVIGAGAVERDVSRSSGHRVLCGAVVLDPPDPDRRDSGTARRRLPRLGRIRPAVVRRDDDLLPGRPLRSRDARDGLGHERPRDHVRDVRGWKSRWASPSRDGRSRWPTGSPRPVNRPAHQRGVRGVRRRNNPSHLDPCAL